MWHYLLFTAKHTWDLWFSWQYLGQKPSAFCERWSSLSDFLRSVFSCAERAKSVDSDKNTQGHLGKKQTNRCNITRQAATLASQMFNSLLTWTLDYPAGTGAIVRTFHTCKNLLFITSGSEECDKTSNLQIYSSKRTSWIVHEATHPTRCGLVFFFFFFSSQLERSFHGICWRYAYLWILKDATVHHPGACEALLGRGRPSDRRRKFGVCWVLLHVVLQLTLSSTLTRDPGRDLSWEGAA